jgi:hypothetical protein
VASEAKSRERGNELMLGYLLALGAFSSYMSSPWSTEAFASGDPVKAASARRLVAISIATALTVGLASSWLDKNPWGLVGASTASAVMWFLYEDALRRASEQAATPNQQGTGR